MRGYYQSNATNPVEAAQIARMREGLRLAGLRDHVDEDTDLHIASDDVLHKRLRGANADDRSWCADDPDAGPRHHDRTAKAAYTGRDALGHIGSWRDRAVGRHRWYGIRRIYQERLGRKMLQLTGGVRDMLIVTMGWNAERYQGRNLALRLVALGYTNVYWYRGDREAWEVVGQPETQVEVQDW